MIDERLAARGLLVLGLAVLAAASPRPAIAAEGEGLRMSATAVNMSGLGRASTADLTIVIERWSSDAERQRLLDTLVESGSEALMEAVQDVEPRAGFIRTSTSLGWAIKFARRSDLPGGGTRVVFVTDRPMSFYELRNGTRSAEYDFMLCEIRLGPGGQGEGKLATAAKVSFDRERQVIEIESYGTEPVRLTRVVAGP